MLWRTVSVSMSRAIWPYATSRKRTLPSLLTVMSLRDIFTLSGMSLAAGGTRSSSFFITSDSAPLPLIAIPRPDMRICRVSFGVSSPTKWSYVSPTALVVMVSSGMNSPFLSLLLSELSTLAFSFASSKTRSRSLSSSETTEATRFLPPVVGAEFITQTDSASGPSIRLMTPAGTFPCVPGSTASISAVAVAPISAGRVAVVTVLNLTTLPVEVETMVPTGTTTSSDNLFLKVTVPLAGVSGTTFFPVVGMLASPSSITLTILAGISSWSASTVLKNGLAVTCTLADTGSGAGTSVTTAEGTIVSTRCLIPSSTPMSTRSVTIGCHQRTPEACNAETNWGNRRFLGGFRFSPMGGSCTWRISGLGMASTGGSIFHGTTFARAHAGNTGRPAALAALEVTGSMVATATCTPCAAACRLMAAQKVWRLSR